MLYPYARSPMSARILLLFVTVSTVLAFPRDKPETWLQVQSPHFLVITEGNEKQGRHVADQFERMRSVFQNAFPGLEVDPGAPILVLATKDQKSFRALEPQDYLGKGKLQLGGLFLRAADKNYVLMRLDAEGDHPYAVIYHEYTHLLTSKVGDWLPLWLNEGLAEFYQNTEIHEKDAWIGEPSAENLLLLRQNRLLPLATLFAVDRNSPYYHEQDKGTIFYAESWALTHYLLFNDNQQKTHHLIDFLDLASQKVDSVTAATRAFGDLTRLQKNLEQYVNQQSFHYVKVPASTQVDESAFESKELSETQAAAIRADFLAYVGRTAEARALLNEILQQDPNNVSAHETMGFLAFHEGNIDEARKWYGEAVKLDSQSYLAHYYFAVMSMRSGALSPENEAQVENSLKTAIKLNAAFAPSDDALAAFYGMGRRNLDDARMLSLQAIQLDPANLAYRLTLANILMEMDRGKDAVDLIQRSMKLAKSPVETERAQVALDRAQRYVQFQERRAQETADQPAVSEESGENSSSDSARPVLRHREEVPPSGTDHSLNGVIKGVHCSPPGEMDFELQTPGKTIDLHSGNYFKIQYSTLNFTPSGDLKPCTQLEGMHAKVEYIEPSDKTARPWIVAVELQK